MFRHRRLYCRVINAVISNARLTSSSAIAERPHCRVGQFGQNISGRRHSAPNVLVARKLKAVSLPAMGHWGTCPSRLTTISFFSSQLLIELTDMLLQCQLSINQHTSRTMVDGVMTWAGLVVDLRVCRRVDVTSIVGESTERRWRRA